MYTLTNITVVVTKSRFSLIYKYLTSLDISDYLFLDLLMMCNENIDGKYSF
jgi:hypothetical protein